MKINQLPDTWSGVVGIDIETTGLDFTTDRILSIAVYDGKEVYVLTEGFGRVVPLLERPDVVKVAHNAIFDMAFICFRYPCKPANLWCTLIVEKLLFAGYSMGFGLDEILARRFHVLLDKSVRETFVNHEGEITPEQLHYIEEDVLHLLKLQKAQADEACERAMGRIVKLENNTLLPVLDMVLTGVGFDFNLWDQMKDEIDTAIDHLYNRILDSFDPDFYIEVDRTVKKVPVKERIELEDIKFNSPQQLLEVLHKLGINVKNTASATLEKYADDPFVSALMEWKTWVKMRGWKWDEYVSPATGRIHPEVRQLGADSGRMSMGSPNLQQIPRPHQNMPNFRRLFRPLEEHCFWVGDYSQNEPRCLAAVSDDPKLILAAREQDVYIEFAKAIWNKEVTKKDEERQVAKSAVLATFYGAFPKKLASTLHKSEQEADKLRTSILTTFPVARTWGDRQLGVIRRYGYSASIFGRRRYFPEILNSETWKYATIARNNPIQAAGATILKIALCLIHRLIQDGGYDAHIMLAVHDEIVVSVRRDQAEDLGPKLKQAMERAGELAFDGKVRFPVDGHLSEFWEH